MVFQLSFYSLYLLHQQTHQSSGTQFVVSTACFNCPKLSRFCPPTRSRVTREALKMLTYQPDHSNREIINIFKFIKSIRMRFLHMSHFVYRSIESSRQPTGETQNIRLSKLFGRHNLQTDAHSKKRFKERSFHFKYLFRRVGEGINNY